MVHFEFWQESLFLLRYSATALAEERVFPLGIPTPSSQRVLTSKSCLRAASR